MRKLLNLSAITLFTLITCGHSYSLNSDTQSDGEIKNSFVREKILMDFNWLFSLGHAKDESADFGHGTSYFSYFAKAGYGDGAASPNFDDRAWRKINLPHDWCIELPFDSTNGFSHGFKAIGRKHPENSVGWYRKKFAIPKEDLGRKFYIEFDGVYRNSIVWVNGFYLGTEESGYTSFSYDITDYLNYGGENVLAVRADATMEEGWFYEGAGIYRHTWLVKTSPLHVERYGTFITSELQNENAIITNRTNVINESDRNRTFDIEETILDARGNSIITGSITGLVLEPGSSNQYYSKYNVSNPTLWTLERPYLHRLVTTIRSNGDVVDEYETTFGIRTIKFDADSGFFLNGKNIKLLGTNLHQDHAGVGTALPDALQDFRINRLKEMGSNAIRTSHNPPSPEFLDACDRLGMLVMDENRLMGTNDEHLRLLKQMIKRDRNHPSVILWSLGNEEWTIEGNEKGAGIASTMQSFGKKLDSSRAFTVGSSGGWDTGIGKVTEVIGYNYLVHGDIDEHHKKFPWQAGVGTEETTASGTRGIYFFDNKNAHMPFRDHNSGYGNAEEGWKFYSARPFLAGLFYWTGFDYHGEPQPYGWPQVTSQYGIVDLCGFPKNNFYYLKSWWTDSPVLSISPHWNWPGKEGEEFNVTVNSNYDEVQLLLNGIDMGRKQMPRNGHLSWKVLYQPGIVTAIGFKNGDKVHEESIKTTGSPSQIQLSADKTTLIADAQDVSVITVKVNDDDGLNVPTAANEINFTITGPAKIIGVGNGNPSSHEAEKLIETIRVSGINNLKEFPVSDLSNRTEVGPDFDDVEWIPAFSSESKNWKEYKDSLIIIRGEFELPVINDETEVNLFTKSIVDIQSIFVNGKLIAANIKRDAPGQSFGLTHEILRTGKNIYAVSGKRFKKKHQWDEPNRDPGLVQLVSATEQWKRKVFNGLAQVIIQSTKQHGDIILKATSGDLKQAEVRIKSIPVELIPSL